MLALAEFFQNNHNNIIFVARTDFLVSIKCSIGFFAGVFIRNFFAALINTNVNIDVAFQGIIGLCLFMLLIMLTDTYSQKQAAAIHMSPKWRIGFYSLMSLAETFSLSLGLGLSDFMVKIIVLLSMERLLSSFVDQSNQRHSLINKISNISSSLCRIEEKIWNGFLESTTLSKGLTYGFFFTLLWALFAINSPFFEYTLPQFLFLVSILLACFAAFMVRVSSPLSKFGIIYVAVPVISCFFLIFLDPSSLPLKNALLSVLTNLHPNLPEWWIAKTAVLVATTCCFYFLIEVLLNLYFKPKYLDHYFNKRLFLAIRWTLIRNIIIGVLWVVITSLIISIEIIDLTFIYGVSSDMFLVMLLPPPIGMVILIRVLFASKNI